MFYLLFEFHFLIYLTPLMHHYPCSYLIFFPSFLLIHLSIHDKKEESILESIPKCIVISIQLMSTFSGKKFYLMHIRRGRMLQGRCIYQGGEDIFLSRKPCFVFVLPYICFLILLYGALSYI